MDNAGKNFECCPPFDPAPWEAKIHEWKDKKFIKGSVRTFFHIPLNFPSVIKNMTAGVEKSGAGMPQWLCLSDHTSKWNMDLYLAVDREVAEAENVTLSGRYVSRVYEGNYRNTGAWCADFENYLKTYGYTLKKMYMWYTTCPKCAKKYGKNYVAIIGEV